MLKCIKLTFLFFAMGLASFAFADDEAISSQFSGFYYDTDSQSGLYQQLRSGGLDFSQSNLGVDTERTTDPSGYPTYRELYDNCRHEERVEDQERCRSLLTRTGNGEGSRDFDEPLAPIAGLNNFVEIGRAHV